jgi:hypothetical protein
MADVEQRVSVIEQDLKELAYAQRKTEMSLQNLSEEMREFKDEMAAFKGEMSEFKDEMSEFKDEMREFKDEMREFKDEMREFKDEMREIKDETRADRKQMNREWGNLANKMGTIVEDIILPGFPGILKKYFGIEPDLVLVRARKRNPNDRSRMREFDILATSDTHLFVNETKSRPSVDSAKAFADSYRDVLTFFPEYAGRTVVPIYSALSLPEEVVAALSSSGCYAVALGEEHLELLNFDAVGAA